MLALVQNTVDPITPGLLANFGMGGAVIAAVLIGVGYLKTKDKEAAAEKQREAEERRAERESNAAERKADREAFRSMLSDVTERLGEKLEQQTTKTVESNDRMEHALTILTDELQKHRARATA